MERKTKLTRIEMGFDSDASLEHMVNVLYVEVERLRHRLNNIMDITADIEEQTRVELYDMFEGYLAEKEEELGVQGKLLAQYKGGK